MNNRFAQSDRDQLMMFSPTLGDNLDKNHEIYAFVKLLDTEDDLMLHKAEKYMKLTVSYRSSTYKSKLRKKKSLQCQSLR